MNTLLMARLQEVMIVLYATSVLFYFLDFVQQNRKANKLAFWLLAIVWVFQTIFLCFSIKMYGRLPILTITEGLYFYAWILVTLSLLLNRLFRVDFTLFFVNVIGFLIMVIHTFAPDSLRPIVVSNKVVSELLVIHITMALFSYVMFSFSYVFSTLFIFQYQLLKKKKWGHQVWRIPNLKKLGKLSYVLNVIGVPILLLSLILGLQWGYLKYENFHWYDLKIINSFILLMIYSVIIFVGRKRSTVNIHVAWWNILAFLLLLVNFFLVSQFSEFHYVRS